MSFVGFHRVGTPGKEKVCFMLPGYEKNQNSGRDKSLRGDFVPWRPAAEIPQLPEQCVGSPDHGIKIAKGRPKFKERLFANASMRLYIMLSEVLSSHVERSAYARTGNPYRWHELSALCHDRA
jgi:hypothetical protein